MSLTTRVLTGLVAGLGLGAVVAAVRAPLLLTAVSLIEPLGTLWVNAIRMTVIPLVVSLLIGGIASASGAGAIGRIGGRALLLFFAFLGASALFAAMAAPPLLSLLRLDPAAVTALRESVVATGQAAVGARDVPTLREWLVGLIPVNPVGAAADGQMLPLIVFSLVFALGVLSLGSGQRELLVRFFEAVSDTMLVVVRWVLAVAPLGVFALALPLALRLGLGAAGSLVYYILVVAGLCTAYSLSVYPVTAVLARMPLREFARAVAPAQGVALSSRSSLASLPPMIEEAELKLRLSDTVTGFVLPLAVSVFRASVPIGNVVAVLFIARLYGVELGAAQVATVAVTASLLSFSTPGIPGGSIIMMAPVLMAGGVPVEGIGILLAVDTIPDMFRTTTNVTADMAVAVILGRGRTPARAPADVPVVPSAEASPTPPST
ncbi:MAG: dicarboxylate/amino acid:cation symporter [Gemmatimonadetes bacterium]|nr:dicarboxylate/amino acid:cation symporter [Gemmatimonadota bacterium]